MRKYNHKISERANESLRKREAVVRKQKSLLAIAIIVIVALGILLGSGLGYFDFYYLNKKLNEVSDIEVPDLKRIVKKNRNFRYYLKTNLYSYE